MKSINFNNKIWVRQAIAAICTTAIIATSTICVFADDSEPKTEPSATAQPSSDEIIFSGNIDEAEEIYVEDIFADQEENEEPDAEPLPDLGYYPESNGQDTVTTIDETNHSAPFSYAPLTPDTWKNALIAECDDAVQDMVGGFRTSAEFITSSAKKLGLVSINTFCSTYLPDELYKHLKNGESISASDIDPAEYVGDILFLPEGTDTPFFEYTAEESIKEMLASGADEDTVIAYKNSHKTHQFGQTGLISYSDNSIIRFLTTNEEGRAVYQEIKTGSLPEQAEIVHVTYKNIEEIVYDTLIEVLPNLNPAAIAGIMANIYCESGYNSTAIGDNGMSYGLCQWYMNRNTELHNYCAANGWSPDSIRAQINFLDYELHTNQEVMEVLPILNGVNDDQYGAYYAGYIFCMIFESPTDTANKALYRASVAQASYRYRYPTQEDILMSQQLMNVPQTATIRTDAYKLDSEDHPFFLEYQQSIDSVKIDGIAIDADNYYTHTNDSVIVLYKQFMDALEPGWHEMAVISDTLISHGDFMIESKSGPAVMSKPAYKPETTAIIFTDEPAPRTAADISAAQDFAVVMWYDGSICYISTQKPGEKVIAPKASQYFFSAEDGEGLLRSLSYIDVSFLDTSNVRDMSGMFKYCGYDSGDFTIRGLETWDVSGVTDMSNMFSEVGHNATNWSIGNLSSWDVSSVADMSYMFRNAGYNALTWTIGDISNWKTANVADMSSMFQGAGYNSYQFVLDLRLWDISSVTTMASMFENAGYGTDIFSLNIGIWDTSPVENMRALLKNAGHNAHNWTIGDIGYWDVSHVTDMRELFCGAGYEANFFVIDLSRWNTQNVETMEGMFESAGYNASVYELTGLSGWNVSNVENMNRMFRYSGFNSANYILDLSSWQISSLDTANEMFSNAAYNADNIRINVNGWNTGNLSSIKSIFENFGYNAQQIELSGLDSWVLPNVRNAASAFSGVAYMAKSISLNIGAWDLVSAEDISRMFKDMGCNATDFVLNLEGFKYNPDAETEDMFLNTGNRSGYTASIA